MGRTYYLDLLTLVTNLRTETAWLRTSLTRKNAGISSPSTGFVRVERGKIVDCRIESQNGALLTGPRALQILQQIQEWYVELDPPAFMQESPRSDYTGQAEQPTQTRQIGKALQPVQLPHAPHAPYVPQRRMQLQPHFLQGFSTRERMIYHTIFAKIDGKHTVEEIKQQLRLAPEVIDYVLTDLRNKLIIE